MLDENKLKQKLTAEIVKLFDNNGPDLINTLYKAFKADSEEITRNLNAMNDLLSDTLETIASLFGLEYNHAFSPQSTHANTKELVTQLQNLASTVPRQRYLIFCISDDCGHTTCYAVTEKNQDYIDLMWSSHGDIDIFEFVHENSPIILELSNRLHTTPQALFELEDKELYEHINNFLVAAITDNTITLAEFSTYIEQLLNTSRSSGHGATWAQF